MAVLNVHERPIPASSERVGALIDALASDDDPLWPHRAWPRMRLHRGLRVGSRGGHGPIGYTVTAYVPGQWIRFRFSAPGGFEGFHEFTVVPEESGGTVLRHVLAMRLHGSARLSWPLAFRWLHDALLEECLDRAVLAFEPANSGHRKRAPYVRLLRHLAPQTAARAKWPAPEAESRPAPVAGEVTAPVTSVQ
ncbi:SRPBCC family protein [Streptomyces palmae]|uniref:SRPBCC family protein n=1 Tax=Streptomyces palmae TaxID=1701085 RepID=A0A4Z0G707_9ACTN|nr:SRPBCC family protein [Streptomyces palmae]TGA90679.1 SRPBCC family protein [Streptomyces palmae]